MIGIIVTNATTSTEDIDGNHCWSDDYGFRVCYSGGPLPKFWLTLNKFTIYDSDIEEVIYFYLDYRDCRYGHNRNDLTILVDAYDQKVYYHSMLERSCDPEENYTEITEGDTLKIWRVNDYSGSHDVSCMCATPTLESITPHYNKPKITWSHKDDPNGSYSYEIWRLLADNFFKIPVGIWYLINTVTDTSYIDNEIYLGDGTWGRAWYKIRAKIDDLKSDYSYYAYINFEGIQKPLVHNSDIVEITEFKIYTNYPNPFNPSTKISFDIPEKTHVDLAVYDIQGKKVVTLVNEMLEQGNYSIDFNAGHLPSGTYLYKIVAGEFSDSKKMILVK